MKIKVPSIGSRGISLVETLMASGMVAATSLIVAGQFKEIKKGQTHMELLNDQLEMQRVLRTTIQNPTLCTASFANAPFDPAVTRNPEISDFSIAGKNKNDFKVGELQIESILLKPALGLSAENWSVLAEVRTKSRKNVRLKPFVVSLNVKMSQSNKKVIKCLSESATASIDDQSHPLPNCQANEILQPNPTGGWTCFPMGNFLTNNQNVTNNSTTQVVNRTISSETHITNNYNNVIQPPIDPRPPRPVDPPADQVDLSRAGRSCRADTLGVIMDARNLQMGPVNCAVTSYNPSTLPSWYTKSPLPTTLRRIPIMKSAAAPGVVTYFEATSIGVSYDETNAFSEEVSFCSDPNDIRTCKRGVYDVYTANLDMCRGTATCQNDGTWFVNYCECQWKARVSEEIIR
jgi:hypothetical protein